MKTMFEFSVIASGLNPQDDDFESRFFDAGCDDATVSFQRGHIIVDFARDADSMVDAIASAVLNVRSAGATVDRVEPDPLVSLSEIAARSAMTRAAMTQYSKGQRGKEFPAPVARVTSNSPLWDWASVARWLFVNDKLSREAVIAAEAVSQANLVLMSGAEDFSVCLHRRVERFEACLAA